MKYLIILLAATTLLSCNKDKRYICWCYDTQDTVIQNNPFYAKSFTEGESKCNNTEDSLQVANVFNDPYCKIGGGEK